MFKPFGWKKKIYMSKWLKCRIWSNKILKLQVSNFRTNTQQSFNLIGFGQLMSWNFDSNEVISNNVGAIIKENLSLCRIYETPSTFCQLFEVGSLFVDHSLLMSVILSLHDEWSKITRL